MELIEVPVGSGGGVDGRPLILREAWATAAVTGEGDKGFFRGSAAALPTGESGLIISVPGRRMGDALRVSKLRRMGEVLHASRASIPDNPQVSKPDSAVSLTGL